jgi:hypothetical protein
MKKELDEALCKKYPKIFRDRHAPMTQTAMCWGFDCGDGWYNIIDAMCSNVQWHIDQSRKNRLRTLRYNRALKRALNGDNIALIKYYNWGLSERNREWAMRNAEHDVEEATFRIVPEICPQVVATQVKEKFGTLRFYYYGGDDYCRGAESMAASMTARTCEDCGNPGKLLTQGWHRTLCETHAKEQGYEWNIEVSDEEDED